MARARRGRCHRQRRLRRWSFSGLKYLLVGAFYNWLQFVHNPALLDKDYEKVEIYQKVDEQVKSKADRYAGYKSICLFGLGSLFWGSATGYLGQLQETDVKAGKVIPRWMSFWFVYSAVALVFMLLGVAAATFPKSSWCASSLAGFGSLHALILVLGGFHVASLKYHPYENECFQSMVWSTAVIILYWGISVQDPFILHVMVKLIFWLASYMIYGVGWVILKVCQYDWQYSWTKVKTKVLALKTNLMAGNTVNEYHSLPQTAERLSEG